MIQDPKPELLALFQKAEKLAGRRVEVVGVRGGYVVEWFAAGELPPPVRPSEAGALEAFIEKMEHRKLDPQIESAELPKSDEENT